MRQIREEFAECRDDRRSLETLRNRKIRYPLSVEIWGHAVNFLGGMTAQEENKGKRRMEEHSRAGEGNIPGAVEVEKEDGEGEEIEKEEIEREKEIERQREGARERKGKKLPESMPTSSEEKSPALRRTTGTKVEGRDTRRISYK